MSQAEIVAGATCRISDAITDIDGVAADPGALRLKVRSPSGTVTTYTYGTDAEVVRSAAGAYHADLALAVAGTWRYRWESDAPNPGAAEGSIVVTASVI